MEIKEVVIVVAITAMTVIVTMVPFIIYLVWRDKKSEMAHQRSGQECHDFQRGLNDQVSKAFVLVVDGLNRSTGVLAKVLKHLDDVSQK